LEQKNPQPPYLFLAKQDKIKKTEVSIHLRNVILFGATIPLRIAVPLRCLSTEQIRVTSNNPLYFSVKSTRVANPPLLSGGLIKVEI
jgi:hypothetical protein